MVNKTVKTRKNNPNTRGTRMRISRQRFMCNLRKSMETSIVVQLTYYGQNSLEMGTIRAMTSPPPMPLITGGQRGCVQSKKETFSNSRKGAASVFAHAQNTSSSSAPSIPISAPITTSAFTPNNQANLRRKYLEDLCMLSQHFKYGVLTDDEFQDIKLKMYFLIKQ